MKKNLILIAIFAIGFIACNKDKIQSNQPLPVIQGTLLKDNSMPDQTVESPVMNLRVFAYQFIGGDRDTILRVYLNVGSTIPVNQITNARIVIKRSINDSIILTSATIAQSGSWSDTIRFRRKEVTSIVGYLTFSGSIVGKVFTPQLTLKNTDYPGPDIPYVTGQTTTFMVGQVTTSVSATTPAIARVAGDQKIETLQFNATAIATASDVTNAIVSVPNANIVSSAEVFDGTTSLGTATFVGNSANIALLSPIVANGTKTYSVKLQLKPINVGSGLSGTSIKTSVSVRYRTVAGVLKSNDTLRIGNDITVYRAVPTFLLERLTGTMVNGVRRDVWSLLITAPVQGDIAIKQLGLPLVLADNGSNDTLKLNAPMLSFGGIDVTSMTRISKPNGDTISSIGEDIPFIYLTPTASPGEYVIPAGTSKRLVLSVIREGFDPGELDGFSIGLAGDASGTTYRYLNAGSSGFHSKLYLNAAPPNSAAQPFNIIWSDKSSAGHTPAPGLSSNDWFNGYLLYEAQAPQVWTRKL